MTQLRALLQHLREKHLEEANGNDIKKSVAARLENNFITPEELDKVAGLPEGLRSPQTKWWQLHGSGQWSWTVTFLKGTYTKYI